MSDQPRQRYSDKEADTIQAIIADVKDMMDAIDFGDSGATRTYEIVNGSIRIGVSGRIFVLTVRPM
jgi:hypothetical protein